MLSGNYTYWVLQTIAMLFTAFVLPGLRITNLFGAFIIVLLIGLVNSTVWDAALFYQMPDSFTIHSLVLLLSNALMFWLLVKIVPGIEIKGMMIALVAPLVFTLFSLLIHVNFKDARLGVIVTDGIQSLADFRDRLVRGEL